MTISHLCREASLALASQAFLPCQAQAGSPQISRAVSLELCESSPQAVGLARAFVAEQVERWSGAVVIDEVVTCVSELVTNALVHVQGYDVRVDVTEFPGCCLLVEVWDADAEVPRPRGARVEVCADTDEIDLDGLELGGRGLAIVRAYADAFWWCTSGTGGGKAACARFDYNAA